MDFPRADTETIEAAGDGLEAFNALFLARGWGDGLPLVPPTPERVKAMLAGYDLPDDFPIATLPPLDGVATVGKIAGQRRHGGMRAEAHALARGGGGSRQPAGIRPARRSHHDQPRLRARHRERAHRQAARHQRRDQHLRRGNRANACIGRALHLIISNVGGSRPGITDMSTLGPAGDFAMFLAENADASPWPSFHTEYGFLPERNVVTVAAVEGYSGIMGIGYSRPEYLDLIAAWLRGHDRPYRRSIILLVAQDTAQMLAREGWTREAMRQYIRERARSPSRVEPGSTTARRRQGRASRGSVRHRRSE